MFMVSCFGLSQASVHRPVGGRNDAHALPEAVGFLTLGRLRQSAGACNAKISTSGKNERQKRLCTAAKSCYITPTSPNLPEASRRI
jgi:hypothetical protein